MIKNDTYSHEKHSICNFENADSTDINVYKERCKQLEEELTETRSSFYSFQETSRELEDALEQELEYMEKQYQTLTEKNVLLQTEIQRLKSKYEQSLNENTSSTLAMQQEIETLRETDRLIKSKMVDLELNNDAMEHKERIIQSSFENLEIKYNKIIEENAFLEAKLASRESLEIDNQRLKDELRDVYLELSLTKKKLEQVETEKKKMASRALLLRPARRLPNLSSIQMEMSTKDSTLGDKKTTNENDNISSKVLTEETDKQYAKSYSIEVMQEMSNHVKNFGLHLQSCRILMKPLASHTVLPNSHVSPIVAYKSNNSPNQMTETSKQLHDQSVSSPSDIQNVKTFLKNSLSKSARHSIGGLSLTYSTKLKSSVNKTTYETLDISPSKTTACEILDNSKYKTSNPFQLFSIKKKAFENVPMKSSKRQTLSSQIPVSKELLKQKSSDIS
ncbi:hypothetical protein PCK1_000311 [Pneumocystis canis]|nr:hypothetical protein PCK1_000311 [Pneumocystis canis]